MSDHQEPIIAASFYNIHAIITRGLKVSIETNHIAIQNGFQDAWRQEGFFKYIQALRAVLHSHHLTEDEIAFPYFREKMPEAPFEILINWHQEMVEILQEIKLAAEKCQQAGMLEAGLKELESALVKLDETWQPHIQMETDEFISKVDALITRDEQLMLIGAFSQHGQQHALPPNLTVPFMLYNLPPDARIAFSHGMPAEVLEHLVPVVWKPDWEAMQPYLLE